MKTYKHLFEQVVSEENIRQAIEEAAKGKRERRDVKRVLNNIDFHVERVQKLLINEEYSAHIDRVCVINEGTHMKVRRIRKPHFKYDQIIHHAVIQVLEPILMKPMYEMSCGSIPGRGSHYGRKRIEKWIRSDIKNTKYVFKMDIKHFYESVDKDILKAMLQKKIKDWRMLKLLFEIIDGCERGLPLGNYTSQWFANFMLTQLDHHIKEQLKVKYYVRYMDDIVIFGANKKRLHEIHREIEEYLRKEFHLRIKENWQVYRFEYVSRKDGRLHGRDLDFMGFRFKRNRTILRRSIHYRITRKARRVGKHTTIQGAYGMVSYMGYIKNTDSYTVYENYIRPYVNIGKLKKFISVRKKKEAIRHENYMANRNRNTSRSST